MEFQDGGIIYGNQLLHGDEVSVVIRKDKDNSAGGADTSGTGKYK